MEKSDDKPVPIPAQIQPPSFLSEMKMALGKQTRPEDKEDSEGNYLLFYQSLWQCRCLVLSALNVRRHVTLYIKLSEY